MVAAIGITAAAGWEWSSTPAVLVVTSVEPLTHNGLWKQLLVTDGSRVYFAEWVKQHVVLAQVSVGGGETSTIPTPFAWASLHDIAPDRSSLLVSEFRWNEPSPLWILPLPQGAPRMVGNAIANWATWTPDGKEIIFARGAEIWISAVDGSRMRMLWTAPVPPFSCGFLPTESACDSLCVSNPDVLYGKRIRTVRGAHRLLAGWQEHPAQNGGSWTPDGRYYVFGVFSHGGEYYSGNLWLLPNAAAGSLAASRLPSN